MQAMGGGHVVSASCKRAAAILCLSLLIPLLSWAQPYTFLSVEAQANDGMFALLRRYGLPTTSCYQRKFLDLNELSIEDALFTGRSYRVPVLVYTYNERSIRTTIGIENLPLARQIQDFNRTLENRNAKRGAYEQSRELWVPYGLLFCDPDAALGVEPNLVDTELSPPEPRTSEAEPAPKPIKGYAIFGEQYAEVARLDDALANQIFYLVAGHGGPDPGAMGSKQGHTLCEDEYAYDVTLRLARAIIQHGGVPYVIVRDPDDGIRDDQYLECDQDELVWGDEAIPLRQRTRLRQRSDVINDLARQHRGATGRYCITIHVDSRHQDRQTDLFFYHQKGNEASRALSETMRETVAENYRRHGRTREYTGSVYTRDLHMLREVEVPTVYIELGNIQHSFDQQRVLLTANREALAKWFVEGIINGLTAKSADKSAEAKAND